MARLTTGSLTLREGQWKIPLRAYDEYIPTETSDKGLAKARRSRA